MARIIGIVFVLSYFMCSVFAIHQTIPALIWTNNVLHKFPETLAGHTTKTSTFLDQYIHGSLGTKAQNLIVFLQDKLNLADITQNAAGDTYQNVKEAMSGQPSAHLAAVAAPGDAIDSLRRQFGERAHVLPAGQSVRQLALPDGESSLVVVPLRPSAALSRRQQLKQIDAVIGSVTGELRAAGTPYTAVYTAEHAVEEDVGGMPPPSHTGRRLLTVDELAANVTFLNVSGCLFLYATDIRLSIVSDAKNVSSFSLPPLVDRAYTAGSCGPGSNATTSITLEYKNKVTGLDLFQLNLAFAVGRSSWQIRNVTASYTSSASSGGSSRQDVALTAPSTYTPRKFCYHCHDFLLKEVIARKNKSDAVASDAVASHDVITVTLVGFQVQVGALERNEFGRPNDCVPFFTIPIWSGLIVASLLITILAFGIGLLADINTIDRFDDPKGKTITVNVSE